MPGWRRVVELAMTCEEIERLTALSRSRTELASRVSRAQMLLAYREILRSVRWQRVGVHHQTVQRCVERALGYGPLAAIEDRPRPEAESDFYFVQVEDPETAVARIIELVKTRIPKRFGFDPIRDIQVR